MGLRWDPTSGRYVDTAGGVVNTGHVTAPTMRLASDSTAPGAPGPIGGTGTGAPGDPGVPDAGPSLGVPTTASDLDAITPTMDPTVDASGTVSFTQSIMNANPNIAAVVSVVAAVLGGKVGQAAVDALMGLEIGLTVSQAQSMVDGVASGQGPDEAIASTFGVPVTVVQDVVNSGGNTGTNGGIQDQVRNLFVGDNPQYNIPDLVETTQNRIDDAAAGHLQGSGALWNDWLEYEQHYGAEGDRIMGEFETYTGQIAPAYDELSGTHRTMLGNIPPLNLTLPGTMGGATVPLAPGKWVDTIGNAVNTQKGLLDSKFGNIRNFLTGQVGTNVANAGIQQTGMANRSNVLNDAFTTQLNTALNNIPMNLMNKLLTGELNITQTRQAADAAGDARQPERDYLGGIISVTPELLDVFF